MSYIFINQLYDLCNKSISRDYLEHIWKKKFDWDEAKVTDWLVNNLDDVKEDEKAWKEKKKEFKSISDKYMVVDRTPKHIKPYQSTDKVNKIRYINDKVVSNKGDKYIIEKTN